MMEILACLSSNLLTRAFPVKQDERIEILFIFVILQGGVDALSAALLLGVMQGLVVGFCPFTTALYNFLKVVLRRYVSED